MAKAEQFAEAAASVHDLADEASEVADAYVTLCVHAGIAAGDVVCAARLGRYSRGEDHAAAVTLLASVDKEAATHLRALLAMKTLAGYSHQPVSRDRAVRAGRAMDALMRAARSTR
ncbi:hypothetical protein [Cellulomonas endometrii]|uniref:hypothetical protein n=1 Tax=Cellulomonas endometrii TaxID=3036301 RepID=UPI0024AD8FF5|nr:hypothetical protein [Cellulomonas endometrii]